VKPWANIEISGSDLKEKIFDTTPAIVMLPPGQYSVLCANPEFPSFSQSIYVRHGNSSFRLEFSQMDAEKLADTLLQ
jgi:hypothetical protein